ncbi:MAG: hypothetical protein V1859_05750 [archaeon]
MMSNTCVVVSTLYQKQDANGGNGLDWRIGLADALIEKVLHCGYLLTVVDAGSVHKFTTKHDNEPYFFKKPPATLGISAQIAIQVALQKNPHSNYFFLTQPEKYPVIESIDSVVDAMQHQGAAVGIPCRSKGGFHSYYPLQRMCEELGNLFFYELTKEKSKTYLDMWFGVTCFSSEASAYFVKPHEYSNVWNMGFNPILEYLIDGGKVASAGIDYLQPPEQVLAEEKDPRFTLKRIKQLAYLVDESYRYWKKIGEIISPKAQKLYNSITFLCSKYIELPRLEQSKVPELIQEITQLYQQYEKESVAFLH